jgi:hypothetical protein
MDLQPYLTYDPERIATLYFAAPLFKLDQYSTAVTSFPGMNCFAPYATSSDSYLTFRLFQDGRKVGELSSQVTHERGYITAELSDFGYFIPRDSSGLLLIDYYHDKDVPPELYVACTHKRTGVYLAYAAATFMGDTIYQNARENDKFLENTLFWPGIPKSPEISTSMMVINPYKISYSYQVSLFVGNTLRAQTSALKIKPFSMHTASVEELFPDFSSAELAETKDECSLCIAGQYRVVVYIAIQHRETGLITTLDHLHPYMRG